MPKVKIYRPEEIVDVVDKDDNILSQILKVEAHAQGLLHRCVLGQIIHPTKGRLFVRQSRDRQDPGQFVLPVGGHMQAGESEIDALKREAEEEVGYKEEFEAEYVGKMIYDRHVLARHENHYFILYVIYSDQEPVINHESAEFRYFQEDELRKLMKEKPEIFGAPVHHIYKKFFPEFYR